MSGDKIRETEKEEKSWREKIGGWTKKHKKLLIIAATVFAFLLWMPSIYANLSTRSLRYDIAKTPVQNIPKKQIALVFGAGVYPSGQPTPYLQWRVETAVKLLQAGRVDKILVSGDNSTSHYNEPQAMRDLAIKLGAKRNDVIADYAGYSTYDSCYRARYIFQVRDAILVSQGYHLPRAVMTCNGIGINSVGVAALRTGRDSAINYIVREWLSTDKAMVQLLVKPSPTLLGKPEPIQ
jgi:vancomycin permeability regulator SanA